MPKIAPTTNEMLGFSPDARLLIINNDDFGMCQAINEATIQSIKEGLAASCTLMAPCPWRLHSLRLLRENPDIPFGVHLTVVSEQPHYRWGALSPDHEISSLLDETGYFYPEDRIDEMLAQVNLTELEQEFSAQIEWVLATGLKPTHLDSHCHIHTLRETVFDMTLSLARSYGLGIRVGQPELIDRLQRQGYPTDNHPIVDSYLIPLDNKLETYLDLLRTLPPGLSEWAIHPGIISPELKAAVPTWAVRKADFDFLMSPEARQVIQEEGVILVDYHSLQALWQATF